MGKKNLAIPKIGYGRVPWTGNEDKICRAYLVSINKIVYCTRASRLRTQVGHGSLSLRCRVVPPKDLERHRVMFRGVVDENFQRFGEGGHREVGFHRLG